MFNLKLKEKECQKSNSKEENELYGGSKITLKINLPDGRKSTESFFMGQDVEWVKQCISEQLECNRNDFKLYFKQKPMIEILSLSDIAGLENGSIVQVKYNK